MNNDKNIQSVIHDRTDDEQLEDGNKNGVVMTDTNSIIDEKALVEKMLALSSHKGLKRFAMTEEDAKSIVSEERNFGLKELEVCICRRIRGTSVGIVKVYRDACTNLIEYLKRVKYSSVLNLDIVNSVECQNMKLAEKKYAQHILAQCAAKKAGEERTKLIRERKLEQRQNVDRNARHRRLVVTSNSDSDFNDQYDITRISSYPANKKSNNKSRATDLDRRMDDDHGTENVDRLIGDALLSLPTKKKVSFGTDKIWLISDRNDMDGDDLAFPNTPSDNMLGLTPPVYKGAERNDTAIPPKNSLIPYSRKMNEGPINNRIVTHQNIMLQSFHDDLEKASEELSRICATVMHLKYKCQALAASNVN